MREWLPGEYPRRKKPVLVRSVEVAPRSELEDILRVLAGWFGAILLWVLLATVL